MTEKTSADYYRARAQQFAEMSNAQTNPRLQIEYAAMAESYFRLARLAEKNQATGSGHETLQENPLLA
jgi:hypothetical protein